MADIVVVAKTNSAAAADIRAVTETARGRAPKATVVNAASVVTVDDPTGIRGKKVLIVDDDPTLTHGGMAYGARYVGAIRGQAGEIVDPRLSVFRIYPHIGKVLAAKGYSASELSELRATINGSTAEVVIAGTPADLARILRLNKPVVRARYEIAEVGEPRVSVLVEAFLGRKGLSGRGSH